MEQQGFQVERHYKLETAWIATFTNGTGGRTIGVNSEMDALPGVGHACGHNLIAIAGVAVACAVKEVLVKHDISGKVVLLGTPGEEGGGGKVILLEKGAYEGMDVCVMCHPAPGPARSASLSSCLAIQRLIVEYHGHTYASHPASHTRVDYFVERTLPSRRGKGRTRWTLRSLRILAFPCYASR